MRARGPPSARHLAHQPSEPVRPQPDLHAGVRQHVHPIDQQLHDPRLFGREELVPQRVELGEGVPSLVLGDVVLLGPRRAPRAADDLSRALEGLRNAGEVEAALKQLVDARILQEIKISTKGRPRFEYVVNPRIWD